jgi:hypothetical protein
MSLRNSVSRVWIMAMKRSNEKNLTCGKFILFLIHITYW